MLKKSLLQQRNTPSSLKEEEEEEEEDEDEDEDEEMIPFFLSFFLLKVCSFFYLK